MNASDRIVSKVELFVENGCVTKLTSITGEQGHVYMVLIFQMFSLLSLSVLENIHIFKSYGIYNRYEIQTKNIDKFAIQNNTNYKNSFYSWDLLKPDFTYNSMLT